MKKCQKCGYVHDNDNVQFCDSCGHNLSKEILLNPPLESDQLTVPVYRMPKDQFEKLLKSNRMTIIDGLYLGCGMFILLPIVILIIWIFSVFGISLLALGSN